jgi:CRISPR-associated exonuclease Cas4
MIWIAISALVVGFLLILAGKSTRQKRGLTDTTTLDLDDRTLYSRRLGLAGRPDRIVEGHIPEEWKSSLRVYESHRVQLGCYFLLIEEESGVKPTHGFIVTGRGERHRIENTPELRAWVLVVAEQIRAARQKIREAIPVIQPAAKCRACGMREGCGQRNGKGLETS